MNIIIFQSIFGDIVVTLKMIVCKGTRPFSGPILLLQLCFYLISNQSKPSSHASKNWNVWFTGQRSSQVVKYSRDMHSVARTGINPRCFMVLTETLALNMPCGPVELSHWAYCSPGAYFFKEHYYIYCISYNGFLVWNHGNSYSNEHIR